MCACVGVGVCICVCVVCVNVYILCCMYVPSICECMHACRIFNMRNDVRACCVHKGKTGTDESAHVLIWKN